MFLDEPISEEWLLWTDVPRDTFSNMAIDEAIIASAEKLNGRPLLRIYGWDSPSISIGYGQQFPETIEKKYTVVRRITGGGVVFHDYDLTYTFIIPAGHRICKLDRNESYRILHNPITKFFRISGVEAELSPESKMPQERSRMVCFDSPAKFDVITPDKKLAGAAQRRTRKGILHRGSVKIEGMKHSNKRIQKNFVLAYKEEFGIEFVPYNLSEELFEISEKLCSEKYSLDSWNKEKRT